MQPGPPRGETATLEITVTPAMVATVGGEEIHPVYGTAALVQHMEEVCRSLLVPHLREDEEGVGHHIECTHKEPVPVGAKLTLTATVARVGPDELTCEVYVRHNQTLVARGSFEQRVVKKVNFEAAIEERKARM